jgi:hypothetical protein
MICLSQKLPVLKDQLLDSAQIMRPHAAVSGQADRWSKPELALPIGSADMHMWRLITLIRIKMKPE